MVLAGLLSNGYGRFFMFLSVMCGIAWARCQFWICEISLGIHSGKTFKKT